MSVLEEKIRKNKELFDAAEPSEGHFERFREKLDIIEVEETEPTRLWYLGKDPEGSCPVHSANEYLIDTLYGLFGRFW